MMIVRFKRLENKYNGDEFKKSLQKKVLGELKQAEWWTLNENEKSSRRSS